MKLSIINPRTSFAAILATLSIAALTACGSDGPVGALKNVGSKADSEAPAASEQELLLTNEVQGITFDPNAIDPSMMEAATGQFTEGTTIEPQECQKVLDASQRLTDLTATFGEDTQNAGKEVLVGLSLTKQTDVYDTSVDAGKGCEDVTVIADGAKIAEQAIGEQGLGPEAQEMLRGMDLSSNFAVHTADWDPNLSTSPEKVKAEESSGSGTTAGIQSEISSFRIMGIVNNVVVIVTATPIGNLSEMDSTAAQQSAFPGITEENKEAAKTRAIEVFDAQAKKIMDAA